MRGCKCAEIAIREGYRMARGWCSTNRSSASATFRVALILMYSIRHPFVSSDGFPVRLCILPIISALIILAFYHFWFTFFL